MYSDNFSSSNKEVSKAPTLESLVEGSKVSIKEKITVRTMLIITVAFLTGFGLLAIYASSSIPIYHNTGDALYYFRKQLVVAVVGFLGIFIMGHIPFKWIERSSVFLVVLSIILLCLVHVPFLEGRAGGASRWILIKGISFQPAELAKLALVLFLAKNLSRPRCDIADFKTGILPNFIVFFIFAFLLMIQPDLGTTVLLFVVSFLMLFVAGLPYRYICMISLASLIGLVGAIIAAPYRVARILTFLNPWKEIKTGGFQIIQSYLGFQNGGLLGLGLGESRQKLFFLPDAHTDFILSVIGEELGLFGVILVCCLFAFLVYICFKIVKLQTNEFRKFLAFGISTVISFQAILNIGVTMGVLPTKGIALPFLSNGASSLIVFLIGIGILARLSQEEKLKKV